MRKKSKPTKMENSNAGTTRTMNVIIVYTGKDPLTDLMTYAAKLPKPQVLGKKQSKLQKIDEIFEIEDKPETDAGPDKNAAAVEEESNHNRCKKCRKKLGLVGGFPCRCGYTFCGFHRYSDRHDCKFDYRKMGASQIRRDNPLIVPEKLRKL